MGIGEETQVSIAPDDAYGPVDPTAEVEVPREAIPADALSVGQQLVVRGLEGGTRLVRVKEVRPGTVLLDLNHPLAGLTLHFAVRVLGIDGPAVR